MAMARVSAQERLTSTYYDTPDAALKQRGLTLRVRDQGGHYLQTVKEGDLASGDLLSRREWEDAIAEGRPDPDAAQSGPRWCATGCRARGPPRGARRRTRHGRRETCRWRWR